MEKLKPCPFCGGEVWISEGEIVGFEVYGGHASEVASAAVGCESCKIMFSATADCCINPEQRATDAVIEAWNRRANDAE